MIDLSRERPIPVKNVCQMVPGRTGRGVAISTVLRWIFRGRRGVRLESVVIGGCRYTTIEALHRWLNRLNERGAVHLSRTVPTQEVDQALDKLGIRAIP